ncbi:hypothetical protein B0T26DRAFT_689191 [Lasiosphaeria miniovina]|uniref:Heparan-alpha-glucosaminide N-acetyltransferase catalytic domain-containing protein n=1 Tax=Lasiosphaeria miniovina TaxID=1954250 RepID=A0AA40BI31_9PEZI|nr:uncharacterized protein B0T26DRAFT_689191 [Lasiosphaeria miniovina]KAK0734640.1 hypothetical protein B0T26DRAFT_689191 [Lasiosphaeria miniovina]
MPRRHAKPAVMPPQPAAGVQETSFAADAAPELEVLEHRPIPDEQNTKAPKPAPPGARKASARALAPDLLRGALTVLMAMDHNALALRTWPHGTAVDGEIDSAVVHEWNRPVAYVVRTLSHLCAPGFTFLLGMGVVYFGRSRTSLGWSAAQMARHFLVRGVVLTLTTEAIGFILTLGQLWFFNVILFALGVDYLLVGLLWLAVARTEQTLAWALLKVLPKQEKDDAAEPLLQARGSGDERVAPDRTITRAADISWHLHNVALMALAVATIWWNIWLSPTGGHCGAEPRPLLPASSWVRVWFYEVKGPRVLSGLPPLAWLSFAVLGLVYGRVILARAWSTRAIVAGNALAGAAFAVAFVLTRLYRFGNLTEGCLHMPEHDAAPADANQFLVSAYSFFYIAKYPPDVSYWAFSMAGNFALLAVFAALPARPAARALQVLLVFGSSALFFYVVHLFVIFGFGAASRALMGSPASFQDPLDDAPTIGVPSLYVYWAHLTLALALLYPLCRWYGAFKQTKGPNSIWRFF